MSDQIQIILDIFLNSLSNIYGNNQLFKLVVSNLNDKEENSYQHVNCSLIILNELYSRIQIHNGFITYFVNSIKTHHELNICSTKTLICFTIYLWKKINFITLNHFICYRKLFKHIKIILDNSIYLLDKSDLIHILNFNLDKRQKYEIINYENLLLGLSRHDKSVFLILKNFLKKLFKNNYSKFKMSNIRIIENKNFNNNNQSNNYSLNSNFTFRIKKGLYINLNDQSLNYYLSDLNILNSLIFESSLIRDNSHLGFNKKLKHEKYYSNSFRHEKEEWSSAFKNMILESNVKLLIVKNKIENDLVTFCNQNKIITIQQIDSVTFEHIKEIIKIRPLNYINDCDKSNIIKLKVNLLENNSKCEHKCLVNKYIQIVSNYDEINKENNLFTIIIETSLLLNHRVNFIERLKHNLKRLENVLNEKKYLNGNGEIENYLSNKIDEMKFDDSNDSNDSNENEMYFETARIILAQTFKDLFSLVDNKNQLSSFTFDDYKSKIEAWYTGCYINNIFFNSEYSIN